MITGMTAFFATGIAADVVIVLLLIEGAVLLAYGVRHAQGLAPREVVTSLGAGLCLLLALRWALVGADWIWIAAPLAAAGLLHALDLAGRLRRGDATGSAPVVTRFGDAPVEMATSAGTNRAGALREKTNPRPGLKGQGVESSLRSN